MVEVVGLPDRDTAGALAAKLISWYARGAVKVEKLQKRIGLNIRHYRHVRGWTQRELSEAADIPPPGVARYELGMLAPSLRRLCTIADALGVDPAELVEL